jgi:hypothetical protein
VGDWCECGIHQARLGQAERKKLGLDSIRYSRDRIGLGSAVGFRPIAIVQICSEMS